MIARIVMALSLMIAVGPGVAAPPAPAARVQLERWRTRWVLPVRIAGKPRRLLFDTAGGLTLVSRPVIDDAGCRPWGRLTGFRMFGERGDTARCTGIAIDVGGLRTVPPVLGLIDLGKLNPADAPLDGLASLNMFEGRAITIDFAAGLLIVETDASLADRVRAMHPLRIRLSREVQGLALAALVEVPSARGPIWLELDSGNGGTILLGRPIADQFGLDPALTSRQPAHFEIDAVARVDSEDAFAPDLIIDGSLGMPFLSHYRITLDLRNGRGWVAPAAPSGAP